MRGKGEGSTQNQWDINEHGERIPMSKHFVLLNRTNNTIIGVFDRSREARVLMEADDARRDGNPSLVNTGVIEGWIAGTRVSVEWKDPERGKWVRKVWNPKNADK